MRRVALVLAVVVGVVLAGEKAEARRLPKPESRLRAQPAEVHLTPALHKSRGPQAPRKGIEKIPADQDRDKRRTHGVRRD